MVLSDSNVHLQSYVKQQSKPWRKADTGLHDYFTDHAHMPIAWVWVAIFPPI